MANCIRCGRKLPLMTFGKLRNTCKWCVEYYALQGRPESDEDVRQHVMPVPWQSSHSDSMIVTYAIMGVCAAVFAGMALATQGASMMNPLNKDLLHWGANFRPYVVSGDWWRLVTSMFLHINIIHIALNMWCLWQLGSLAESLYGHFTFAAVYLICGVAGSLASIAWHPATPSAGASGAIFGIAGALIASLKLGEFSMPRAAVKGTLSSIVTFAGYNLFFGAVSGITDNAAHIGGLLAGLILGALIALLAPHHDQPVRRLTICALVLMLVIGAAGWMQHAYGYVAHLQRAAEFMRQNQPDKAIAELRSALNQRPNDPDLHFELARAYRAKNMQPQLEAELKRALELHIDNPNARYLLAFLYVEEGRSPEARQLFEQVIAAEPNNADGHRGLGFVLAADGSHEAAIKEFQRALSLDREIGAYYPMGQSYAKLRKWDDAINSYSLSIQVDGDDVDTESALAEAYDAKGMKPQAEQARRKAEQLKNAPPLNDDGE